MHWIRRAGSEANETVSDLYVGVGREQASKQASKDSSSGSASKDPSKSIQAAVKLKADGVRLFRRGKGGSKRLQHVPRPCIL